MNEWIGSLALFDRSIAIAEGKTNRTDHTSFLTIIVQSDINYDYNPINEGKGCEAKAVKDSRRCSCAASAKVAKVSRVGCVHSTRARLPALPWQPQVVIRLIW